MLGEARALFGDNRPCCETRLAGRLGVKVTANALMRIKRLGATKL